MSFSEKPSKKIGILLRQPPYGCSLASEALDTVLTGAAYEQELSVIFMGDGVFQLTSGQNSQAIQQKNIEKKLAAFELYDIDKVFACESSLAERQIKASELSIPVTVIDKTTLTQLLHQQDTLLSF